MNRLFILSLLLIGFFNGQAQYYTPESKITAQGNNITEKYLSKLLLKEQDKAVYTQEQVAEIIRKVESNNIAVESRVLELKSEISLTNTQYNDFIQLTTVKEELIKLNGLRKSLKEIEDNIKKSLLNYSFKTIMICVQPSETFITEDAPYRGKALKYLTPKAIENINGTYIQSITKLVNNVTVSDYIKSVKSGKLQPIGMPLYAENLPGIKQYLYVVEVRVSPLEGKLNVAEISGYNKGITVIDVLQNNNYKQLLEKANIPQDEISKIEQKINFRIKSIRESNNNITQSQLLEIKTNQRNRQNIEDEIYLQSRKVNNMKGDLKDFFDNNKIDYSETDFDINITRGKKYFADKIQSIKLEINKTLERRIEKAEPEYAGKLVADIARKAPELVNNLKEDLAKEQNYMEVTEIESMVVTSAKAGSKTRIVKEIDRVWLYPVLNAQRKFDVAILTSVKILEGSSGSSYTGGYTTPTANSFTDSRDGQVYRIITIGNQVWMAENLNYKTNHRSWCYDDNSRNCDQYGRLYNWETSKWVCPYGWHLPSESEFEILLDNVGNDDQQRYLALKKDGSSGFSALLGGVRDRIGKLRFLGFGLHGYFWSSSEVDNEIAWTLLINSYDKKADMGYGRKRVGRSVRCLQD
jgi:uncharacterized protein (TIGR02145 family)